MSAAVKRKGKMGATEKRRRPVKTFVPPTRARAIAIAKRASAKSVCAMLNNLGRQVDGTQATTKEGGARDATFLCVRAICIARAPPRGRAAPIDRIARARVSGSHRLLCRRDDERNFDGMPFTIVN